MDAYWLDSIHKYRSLRSIPIQLDCNGMMCSIQPNVATKTNVVMVLWAFENNRTLIPLVSEYVWEHSLLQLDAVV